MFLRVLSFSHNFWVVLKGFWVIKAFLLWGILNSSHKLWVIRKGYSKFLIVLWCTGALWGILSSSERLLKVLRRSLTFRNAWRCSVVLSWPFSSCENFLTILSGYGTFWDFTRCSHESWNILNSSTRFRGVLWRSGHSEVFSWVLRSSEMFLIALSLSLMLWGVLKSAHAF